MHGCLLLADGSAINGYKKLSKYDGEMLLEYDGKMLLEYGGELLVEWDGIV